MSRRREFDEPFIIDGVQPPDVEMAVYKDLQALIHSRVFREELYYRINVITIEVPPLRERDSDVLL